MKNGSTPDPAFGDCDHEDLEDLEAAMKVLRSAEEHNQLTRRTVRNIMKRMLGKGAQRKAIASHAGVSDQTVTNIVFGHPAKAQSTKKAGRGTHH